MVALARREEKKQQQPRSSRFHLTEAAKDVKNDLVCVSERLFVFLQNGNPFFDFTTNSQAQKFLLYLYIVAIANAIAIARSPPFVLYVVYVYLTLFSFYHSKIENYEHKSMGTD